MKDWLNILKKITVKVGWGLVLLLIGTNVHAQNKKRPNIIFVLCDDHAYQAISAYGGHLNQTPQIARIAKEGMLFNRAYVTNSLCAPCRAAILTGKYSHLNGITGNGDERFDSSQNTFPQLLHKAGYQTALIGKWHLVSQPTGFDYWNILPGQGDYYNPDFINKEGRKKVNGYVTDLITDYAIDWLDNRDTTEPFCLLTWQKAPHRDWMPAPKYLNLYDSVKFPVPSTFEDDYSGRTRAAHEQLMQINRDLSDNYDLKLHFDINDLKGRLDGNWKSVFGRLNPKEQQMFQQAYAEKNKKFFEDQLTGTAIDEWKYQRYMQDYLSCIRSIDDNVGRLLDYLDKKGLADNTIVIYSSDQGFYLGEHGWFDKRFMYEPSFRTPLLIRWPSVIKSNSVSNELVMNIDIAETLLHAAGVTVPNDMQGKSLLPVLKNKVKGRWRKGIYYHYYESGGEHNVAKHIGVRSDRYKLIYFYENKEWELYDLKKDPNELHNVINETGYVHQKTAMMKLLKELRKQYKDDDTSIVLN
jgi:arylsulfatase A-like enzyme